jgi:hypothetical protein
MGEAKRRARLGLPSVKKRSGLPDLVILNANPDDKPISCEVCPGFKLSMEPETPAPDHFVTLFEGVTSVKAGDPYYPLVATLDGVTIMGAHFEGRGTVWAGYKEEGHFKWWDETEKGLQANLLAREINLRTRRGGDLEEFHFCVEMLILSRKQLDAS